MMVVVQILEPQSGELLGYFQTSLDSTPEELAQQIRVELETHGLLKGCA